MQDMPILARNENQITYIYSSDSYLGKQILGFIQSVDEKVATVNINKEPLANTIWAELAENMNTPIAELFSVEESDIKNEVDFNTDDWLKIINKKPGLLRKPIVVKGGKVVQIANQTEILKFFGVDSAGLEKGLNHESPTISSTTKGERFI